MSAKRGSHLVLHFPPIDGAIAAAMYDLCGQLQAALLDGYGDAMEAHWIAVEPDQPIYGPLRPSAARAAKSKRQP